MLTGPICLGYGVVNPFNQGKDSYSLPPEDGAQVRDKNRIINVAHYVNLFYPSQNTSGL